jgi:DNA-binding IscR family transcriptional regulator
MVALGTRFLAGGGAVTGEQLSDDLGAPTRAVHEALDMLETAGLLLAAEAGGYLPALPLESLTAARVVRACRAVSVPACDDEAPGTDAVSAAIEAMSRELEVSIASLVAAPRPEPTEAVELPRVERG